MNNDINIWQYLVIKLGEMGQIVIGAVCVYAICMLIYNTIHKD